MKTFEITYYEVNDAGKKVLMSKYEKGLSFEEMEEKHPNAHYIGQVIKIIPTTILGDGYNLN